MIIKSFTEEIKLIKDHENLILKRNKGFDILRISPDLNGFGRFKSIVWHPINSKNGINTLKYDQILLQLKNKKIPTPLTIIDSYQHSKEKIVTLGPVSTISIIGYNESAQSNEFSLSTLILINHRIDQGQLIKLLTIAIEARTETIYDMEFNEKISGKNSIFIVCPTDESFEKKKLSQLNTLVHHSVQNATQASLNDFDNSKSVIEFLQGAGIEIDDMIDAGMELLVGVRDQPPIREKFEKQLRIALKDINVIALVIAGIRLESDFENHRVSDVNVDDDPAYLYTDEVLGMAIANQIAGTKAIFNFKRYDEAKPGVIGKLGPIMDDVCAGLVAGCMSKIFEES
jgi:alpha-ribazole phosphatase CobZ